MRKSIFSITIIGKKYLKLIAKKNLLLCGVLFLTFANFPLAFAAATSFYSTEIAIASKSDIDRTKALAEAYKQILAKLSKDPKIINSPEVKAKLKNINMWVQSYSYNKHPAANGQPSLFLKVNFDPQSIPEQIRPTDLVVKEDDESASPNVMSATNTDNFAITNPEAAAITTTNVENTAANALETSPKEDTTTTQSASNVNLLVWLATIGDNAKTNVIVDDTNNNPITSPLQNIAQKAGFSLTLPTMDLQDITKITADDVCDQDINVIKNAARRYGMNKIAAGCIAQTDNGKRGQWLLLTDDKVYNWSFKGNDEMAILQQAFTGMTKILMPERAIQDTYVPSPSNAKADQPQIQPQTIGADPLTSNTATATTPQSIPLQPTAPNISNNTASLSQPTSITSQATTTTANPAVLPNAPDNDEALITSPNQVILYVNNINNLDQYADTVKYLRTIPEVTKVELLNINLSTVKLKVYINGGKKALVDGINKQRKLVPNNDKSSSSSAENNATLNYNWTSLTTP